MESKLIDSTTSIATLIDTIVSLPRNPPSLYIDLEGINLSTEGDVSILPLMLYPQKGVYLIDIHVLNMAAFTTPGTGGKTLRSILESSVTPKVFFDVRNDSNILYFRYGIALRCVEDIQLMECASRADTGLSPKKFVHGLLKCIQSDAPITLQQKQTWKAAKDAGTRLLAPEQGGSYAVFKSRPLREEIKAYCVQDVQILPILRQTYCNRLQPVWKTKVDAETTAWVQLSQTAAYRLNDSNNAFSPWRDFQPSSIFY